MPASRQIVTGEDYTADDINNLRSDVLDGSTGHNHDATDGRKVGFSNLDVSGGYGSTAPSGGSSSYDDIDDHVQSDQEVHGLAATDYVLGTNVAAGIRIDHGFHADARSLGANFEITGSVSFNITFSNAPVVICNAKASHPSMDMAPFIRSVSTTGFDWEIHRDAAFTSNLTGIYWIAIGT